MTRHTSLHTTSRNNRHTSPHTSPTNDHRYPWRVLPSNIVAACKGSLQRLGTEQLSLGQLHWSASNYAPLQEIALWNGLADCYEQGLVKAVGVSNYGEEGVGSWRERGTVVGEGTRPWASVPTSSSAVEFCRELL